MFATYKSNEIPWSYATAFPTFQASQKYYVPAAKPRPVVVQAPVQKVVASPKPAAPKTPVVVKVPTSKPSPAPAAAPVLINAVKVNAKPQDKTVRFMQPFELNKLPPLPPINNSCYAAPKVPPGVTRRIQVNLPTEYKRVELQPAPSNLKYVVKEKNAPPKTVHRHVVATASRPAPVVAAAPAVVVVQTTHQARNVARVAQAAPKAQQAAKPVQVVSSYKVPKGGDPTKYYIF